MLEYQPIEFILDNWYLSLSPDTYWREEEAFGDSIEREEMESKRQDVWA